jgi:hypothetical protein
MVVPRKEWNCAAQHIYVFILLNTPFEPFLGVMTAGA